MDRKIAFLIWIYDTEMELLRNGDTIEAITVSDIRERYMEIFGLNNYIEGLLNGDDD